MLAFLNLSSIENKQTRLYFVQIYETGNMRRMYRRLVYALMEKKKIKFEPGRNTNCLFCINIICMKWTKHKIPIIVVYYDPSFGSIWFLNFSLGVHAVSCNDPKNTWVGVFGKSCFLLWTEKYLLTLYTIH